MALWYTISLTSSCISRRPRILRRVSCAVFARVRNAPRCLVQKAVTFFPLFASCWLIRLASCSCLTKSISADFPAVPL